MSCAGLARVGLMFVLLAGCSVSTASVNTGGVVGGEVVGSLAVPPPTPAASAAMGAFLDGAVGQRLSTVDRERAYETELEALSAGDRKTWRGEKGNFGYVAPASAGADGCRSFTHTVYISGRPQVGTGTGCPSPEGGWRITG